MVLTALVALLWYFFGIQPLRDQTAQVRAEIQNLIPERDRGRQAQRALPQLRALIADLQAQRLAFLRALPQEERLGEVLDELLGEARRSGVQILSFNRSPTQAPTPEVRAVNLALTFEAPFPETYAFLKRLEALSRFTTLSGLNMNVKNAEGPNPILSTGLTLTLYMLAKEVGAPTAQPTRPGTPGQGGGQP